MSEAGADVAELPAGMGARLRREREQRDLTVHQAAEQLNLDPSVIHALESDDYAALGAAVFAKGHLRRYGALLGLPDAELLEAFEVSRAQLPQPTLVPRARVEMIPVRARPKWPWVVGSLLLFLLVAAVIAYLSEYGLGLPGGGKDAAQPAATQQVPPPLPSPSTAQPQAEPTGAAPSAAEAAPGAVPAATPAGQVSLQVSFTADSWVEIYDGSGKAVLYDLGQAGTQRSVTAIAPLSVTFGNAPAVALQVNGRAVTMPAPPAGQTVARFSIGPDGSLH
ncbi:MAG: RodZ domain-containing protein [Steroidobacteraceae bacterium]